MYRRLKHFVIVLAGLVSAPSVSAEAHCPDVKIAYSASWVPVTYDLETKKHLGIALDIHKEAFRRLRQKVSFRSGIPWSRQLRMLFDGEIDAMAAMHHNEERAAKYLYSDPFHISVVRIYVKKDAGVEYTTLDDLIGLKGLAPWAASFGREFDQFAKSYLDITEFQEPDRLVKLLNSGRFDYMVMSQEMARFFIQKANLEASIIPVGPAAAKKEIHLVMSKKSLCTNMMSPFNRTLAQMKSDGTLKRLVARNLELAYGD